MVNVSIDTTTVMGGHETILLVEDSELHRAAICDTLQEAGYTVYEASDPETALALADAIPPPDLLFVDVVMSHMNGRGLSERLARFWPRLQTIYMSGYTASVIAYHRILDEDMPFIEKTFGTRVELLRKIREVLDSRAISN